MLKNESKVGFYYQVGYNNVALTTQLK